MYLPSIGDAGSDVYKRQVQETPIEEVTPMVRDAVHNYFAYRGGIVKMELRRLMKQGRVSLLIGIAFLSTCLFVKAYLLPDTGGPAMEAVSYTHLDVYKRQVHHMASAEEIGNQLERLTIHRNNLSHLLRQQAQYGGLNVPLHIMNSIAEERAGIQQIKAILRNWTTPIDDHPDDTYPVASTSLTASQHPFVPTSSHVQPESHGQVSMPEDVISTIRAQAASTFGTDFATQKFRIRTETEAWHTIQMLVDSDLPPEILTLIKQNAATSHPLDFGTQ